MNKKHILAILSVVFLTSCSSLKDSVRDLGDLFNLDRSRRTDITDMLKDVEIKDENKEVDSESIRIGDMEVSEQLAYIKNNVKESKTRIYENEMNRYTVYMGERLDLRLNGETVAKISDRNAPSYKMEIRNNRLSFMSIYKNVFSVQLYRGSEYVRTIKIETLPKYSITESNIYDIIERNSDKNNKVLEDAITLYKLHYFNGKNYTYVNYILMKYGYNKRTTASGRAMMLEGFEEIKNHINHFEDEEIKDILLVAGLIKRPVDISYSKYDNEYLKEDIKKYILSRPKYTENSINEKYDMAFLEKYYKNNDDNKEIIKALLSDYYKRSGSQSKLNELQSSKDLQTNKTVDRLTYKQGDAISSYKQMLSKEMNFDNKAMLYYKIGNEYAKNGNKVQAKKYLTVVVQQFKNTIWEKESKKLLDSLK